MHALEGTGRRAQRRPCSQRNVTCSWPRSGVQLQIRKAPPGGRGAWRVRRWRRKRGQPGVSALTSATPRFFCHRSVPVHLHTTLRNARHGGYRDWSSTHACPRQLGTSPQTRNENARRFYLARSKPPVFVDRARRQPVFMTVLIRLITAAQASALVSG